LPWSAEWSDETLEHMASSVKAGIAYLKGG
jgi:hypothetical protein